MTRVRESLILSLKSFSLCATTGGDTIRTQGPPDVIRAQAESVLCHSGAEQPASACAVLFTHSHSRTVQCQCWPNPALVLHLWFNSAAGSARPVAAKLSGWAAPPSAAPASSSCPRLHCPLRRRQRPLATPRPRPPAAASPLHHPPAALRPRRPVAPHPRLLVAASLRPVPSP